jgi:hypothetical protein
MAVDMVRIPVAGKAKTVGSAAPRRMGARAPRCRAKSIKVRRHRYEGRPPCWNSYIHTCFASIAITSV